MKQDTLLDSLKDPNVWAGFVQKRETVSPEDPRNKTFKKLTTNNQCQQIASDIADGVHVFSVPV